ncbi:MAG TPA: xylose isomerase [Limnochordia bacterium]|nr:xylose isomerase [Limnochordia bacterium]
MSKYTPTPADRFTFGLWTVGNRGRDPFGLEVRPPIDPVDIVHMLADIGAWGVNLHDNDLVPIDATPSERDQIVSRFKKALEETGLAFVMGTANLFFDPIFKDGAFTSNIPEVRRYALRKTIEAIDLTAELGGKIFVLWGGREGAEVNASKNPMEAVKRFREAVNYLCEYVIDKGYDMKFALEAKPNEPRGDIFFPTTGAYLALIPTLDHPDMVGVNPEFAHETMAGLSFHHIVAQALEMGKLFHIDLNDQKIGRFDQDLRFGSENIKESFFLVKVLEDGGYTGPLHFDAHAYRTEDIEGVKEFAKGCMRSYLILKEKVKQFNEDKEIQAILAELNVDSHEPLVYKEIKPDQLVAPGFDRKAWGAKGYAYERLDQLLFDLLLGVR